VLPELQRAAAVCDLALTIWQVRARAYHLDVPQWHTLALKTRLEYMQLAEDVLAEVKPAAVLSFGVHARD
jgi:hypothetical protein